MSSNSVVDDLIKLIGAGGLEAIQQFPALSAAVTSVDHNGCTPLHIAAWQGKDDIATELILAGADVDAVDMMEATPLYAAVLAGKASTVQLLMVAGADPCKSSPWTETSPLYLAAASGSTSLVGFLTDAMQHAGLSLDTVSSAGYTGFQCSNLRTHRCCPAAAQQGSLSQRWGPLRSDTPVLCSCRRACSSCAGIVRSRSSTQRRQCWRRYSPARSCSRQPCWCRNAPAGARGSSGCN
jgi:hypothetical protein